MRARKISSGRFVSWPDFLERTAEEDREFLTEESVDRFPEVCCGMANGAGGWVVLGALWDEDVPAVRGVSDPSLLERRLRAALAGGWALSVDPVSSFRVLDAGGVPLLITRVEPAEWHRRPVCVGGDYLRGVYRRVEGTNLISGGRVRFRYALDALERLRGDLPVPGLTVSDLHEESVASFRGAVTLRRPEWRALSSQAFLARTQVLSDGALTRSGHLLLGKRGTRVRAELWRPSGEEDIFEVRNLWRAYADLLPRFCQGLTASCAAALGECFVNALVHADHDEGFVRVTGGADTVRVENPGLPRTCRRGESLCRNVRLMRMFRLAGAAEGEGQGLASVGEYQPGFTLRQDLLNLATVAELRLERRAEASETGRAALAEMRLPIAPLAVLGEAGMGNAATEGGGAEGGENPPAPAESVPVASALEFLVAVPSGRAAPQPGTGDAGEAVPDGGGKADPGSVDEAFSVSGESRGGVGDSPASTDGIPDFPEAGAAGEEGEEEGRMGKRFAFGNAAEELERAVARMRCGEGAFWDVPGGAREREEDL